MDTGNFILDVVDNTYQAMTRAVDGLTPEELAFQPGKESNSIGFILWHQTRAEDHMVQGMIRQVPQLWESENWCEKLGFPKGTTDDGWGYTAGQVGAFRVPDLKSLLQYAEVVHAQTVKYIQELTPEGYDEAIKSPMGEMTVGKIFALMVGEITLHTGQIAYLRGLQRGLDK